MAIFNSKLLVYQRVYSTMDPMAIDTPYGSHGTCLWVHIAKGIKCVFGPSPRAASAPLNLEHQIAKHHRNTIEIP
jgi:hypothetical protein